jgi:uncharacterized lipoprotein YmbA
LNHVKDMTMKTRRFRVTCILSAVLCLVATSCNLPQAAPDTTRYYVLAAQPDHTEAPAARQWKISLLPVDVPLFLRSKPMAVRVAANEVRYIEDARWAEPLDAGVGRVFREQLEAMPAIAQVSTSTSGVGPMPDYEVVIRVLRCEGDTTGSEGLARFIASVEIHSAQGDRLARDTLHSEVGGWNGKDYDALARKLSEAVRDLASRVPTLLEKASATKS